MYRHLIDQIEQSVIKVGSSFYYFVARPCNRYRVNQLSAAAGDYYMTRRPHQMRTLRPSRNERHATRRLCSCSSYKRYSCPTSQTLHPTSIPRLQIQIVNRTTYSFISRNRN